VSPFLVSAEKNATQTSDGLMSYYRSQPRQAGLLTTARSIIGGLPVTAAVGAARLLRAMNPPTLPDS